MTLSKAKTTALGTRTWCGTEGAGEFVDHFLTALFADRTADAMTFLDPDLGRRSYGHIREALAFLEGEQWMYIPTAGRTPEGCEVVRFVHLNAPSGTAHHAKPIALGMVDFEIQDLGSRSIHRIGPKRWEATDLTP